MAGDARTPHPSLFQRHADWSSRRWGNHAVAPCSALLVVVGVGLTVAPQRYAGAFYQFVFAAVPARTAGITFLVVGAAAIIVPTRATIAALVATHVCWGITCALAAVFAPGVSPTAWAWPLTVSWVLFMSVGARRAPARRRRR